MFRRPNRDAGGYLVELALVTPWIVILFLALAQLGFQEFERMVLARALTQATYQAASERDSGAVAGYFNSAMNRAWEDSSILGTEDVQITSYVKWVSGQPVLRADLVYEVPSVVPLPADSGWLGGAIRVSSEQPIDY